MPLLRMLAGYYSGQVALAPGDTVPVGEASLVSPELAHQLVADGLATELTAERAVLPPAEAATAAHAGGGPRRRRPQGQKEDAE